MWEKETNYRLSLKKNILYEFCRETYKESCSFDVVFITKDKYKLQAHRVILALSSDLVKNFDVPESDCVIELPDYSAAVVSSFIQFIYTGESLMEFELQEDFLSLCKQMMVNIPGLSEKNFETAEDGEAIETVESQEAPANYMEVEPEDEKEDSDELIEELSMKSSDGSQEETEELSAELLIDEGTYCGDQTRVPFKVEPQPASSSSRQALLHCNIKTKPGIFQSNSNIHTTFSLPPELTKESSQEKKLQEAIEAVKNGMIARKASLLYGIPKTTLYRKLSQAKIYLKK